MSPDGELCDFGALRFGHRGEFQRDAAQSVCDAVREAGVRDLFVLVHGAHNDRGMSDAVDESFIGMLNRAAPRGGERAGVVSAHWPSMCFRDEGPARAGPEGSAPEESRSDGMRMLSSDLSRVFPDRSGTVSEILKILHDRPTVEMAFDSLGSLLRRFAEIPSEDPLSAYATDMGDEVLPQDDPMMLFEETRTMCREFAGALSDMRRALKADGGQAARQHRSGPGAAEVSEEGTLGETHSAGPRPVHPVSDRVKRVGTVDGVHAGVGTDRRDTDYAELWDGAFELFRQVVRFALRRRAGLVGRQGLGLCLPFFARNSGVRLHLVGHGLGGRLAGFALGGLEESEAEPVLLDSLTLLQGEMSHFAFADSLPQQVAGHGALWGLQRMVKGPVVCTFSHLDSHLGVMYPLSTQMIGDSAHLSSTARKWGRSALTALRVSADLFPRSIFRT